MIDWVKNLFKRNARPLSDPFALGGGSTTYAPEEVTPHRAMSMGAVSQAVSMISGDLARMPIEMYQREGDNRVRAQGHKWYAPVKMAPAPNLTAFRAWRRLYFWLLIWGRAFAIIDRSGELIPIPNHQIDVLDSSLTGETLFRVVASSGEEKIFTQSQILELTWLEWGDGWWPEPITSARESISSFLSSQKFTGSFYRNGATPSGLLELPPITEKDKRDNLVNKFNKEYASVTNAFKVITLKDGAKYQQLTATALDMQQRELKEDEVRDIARHYNLTPSRLGLSDAVSYNSKAEDNRSYIDSTLSPFMTMTEQELGLKLLAPGERAGFFFEYNTAALLRADIETRYKVYEIGIRNGILSPSIVAQLENLAPDAGRSTTFVSPQVAREGSNNAPPIPTANGRVRAN